MLREYRIFIVTGRSLVGKVQNSFSVDVPVEVVPHIVPVKDEEIGAMDESEISRNLFALGAITRLRVEKGVEFMLAAFARIARRHPEVSVTLYGETPELDRIIAVAQAFGIRQKLRIHGPFHGLDDLRKISRNHCVFLLSSLFEGTPMAILETMARGRVTVSTDVGGCRDLIGRKAGILVPPGDPRSMAVAVKRLLANPSEVRERSMAAVSRFRHHFYPERVTNRLCSLYRSLMSCGGTSL